MHNCNCPIAFFCRIRMIDLILQAITKTYKIMYSNKDYEKLWQKYQTEGIAHNMTLQMFCSMNNVPYNSFEKYLKTRRKPFTLRRVI